MILFMKMIKCFLLHVLHIHIHYSTKEYKNIKNYVVINIKFSN